MLLRLLELYVLIAGGCVLAGLAVIPLLHLLPAGKDIPLRYLFAVVFIIPVLIYVLG